MDSKRLFSQLQTWIQKNPIAFLILLTIALRLIGITAPVIGIHAWRQADTAAIARNFYENGFNFFMPQIDWGGAGKGYCETEFPIYSWIVAIGYQLFGQFFEQLFGQQEVIARLVSLICSVFGLVGIYQLAERFFNPKTAFWSGIFFASLPLLIYYTRTIQPESMLLMCSIWAVLQFVKWLDRGKTSAILLSSFFLTLACLIKVLPLIYLGIPIAFLAYDRYGWQMIKKPQLWGYAIVPIVCVFLWYSHAHNIFLTYGNTFGFSGSTTDRYNYSLLLTSYFWGEILVKVAVRQFAIFGFFIFIAGLLLPKRNSQEWLFPVWLGASVISWMIVPVTSVVHEYYHLNFMVPGVILMGKASTHYLESSKLKLRRSIAICTSLAFVASAAFYLIDYRSKELVDRSPVYQLAQQIKYYTEPSAKIIATTGGDPSLLYLAHRKGWIVNPIALTPEWVNEKRSQRAHYLVGSFGFVESYALGLDMNQRKAIETVMLKYPKKIQNQDRFIVKLK